MTDKESLEAAKAAGQTCLGAVFLLVVVTPCSMWFDAYVALKLWAWFILPLGAPRITMAQAVGIELLLALMCYRAVTAKNMPTVTEMIGHQIGLPASCLLFGWLIHRFI